MKALITNVEFKKEYETKYGTMYSFVVSYDGKRGYYSSKSKDQNKFVKGQEVEFTEEKRTSDKGEYLIVKPLMANKQSNFGKAIKKEQSKYSGFAVSYAKDLVVSGKLERGDLSAYAWVLFELMVEMDKSIEG